MRKAKLVRPALIQGVSRQSWIRFQENGLLDDVPCNGGWGKVATSFHPNSQLMHVFLSEDAVIQGVACKASLFHDLRFDEEGTLLGEG